MPLLKSLGSILGLSQWLRFKITQHRDLYLLRSLITAKNCGRYISKSGYAEFILTKKKYWAFQSSGFIGFLESACL